MSAKVRYDGPAAARLSVWAEGFGIVEDVQTFAGDEPAGEGEDIENVSGVELTISSIEVGKSVGRGINVNSDDLHTLGIYLAGLAVCNFALSTDSEEDAGDQVRDFCRASRRLPDGTELPSLDKIIVSKGAILAKGRPTPRAKFALTRLFRGAPKEITNTPSVLIEDLGEF